MDERIKLMLDMGVSAETAEMVAKALDQVKAAARGAADSYEVLDRTTGTYTASAGYLDTAMDAQVRNAVEATQAQKAMNTVLEETAVAQTKASGTSRDMQMRILNLGRAAQDLAQGGFAGIINNIEGIVGGGGAAAGILTAIGTAAYLATPYIKEWIGQLGSAKDKIPEATDATQRLTEKIKANKDAIEEMRKAKELDFFGMEKYIQLTRETQKAEEELLKARKLKAIGERGTKAERARGTAFEEALGEYGGPEKLIEEVSRRGQLTPEQVQERILDAAKGSRYDIDILSKYSDQFAEAFGAINPDLDEARKQVKDQVGGQMKELVRNLGINLKQRQKAGKEQEKAGGEMMDDAVKEFRDLQRQQAQEDRDVEREAMGAGVSEKAVRHERATGMAEQLVGQQGANIAGMAFGPQAAMRAGAMGGGEIQAVKQQTIRNLEAGQLPYDAVAQAFMEVVQAADRQAQAAQRFAGQMNGMTGRMQSSPWPSGLQR